MLPIDLIFEISSYCDVSKLKYMNLESHKPIKADEEKWKSKYENYFKDNNIKLPLLPLEKKYNWKKEYDRVVKYKYWHIFTNMDLDCEKLKIKEEFNVFPKEFYELINLQLIRIDNNNFESFSPKIIKLKNLTSVFITRKDKSYNSKKIKIPKNMYKLPSFEGIFLPSKPDKHVQQIN